MFPTSVNWKFFSTLHIPTWIQKTLAFFDLNSRLTIPYKYAVSLPYKYAYEKSTASAHIFQLLLLLVHPSQRKKKNY